jgi:hypothetical protein
MAGILRRTVRVAAKKKAAPKVAVKRSALTARRAVLARPKAKAARPSPKLVASFARAAVGRRPAVPKLKRPPPAKKGAFGIRLPSLARPAGGLAKAAAAVKASARAVPSRSLLKRKKVSQTSVPASIDAQAPAPEAPAAAETFVSRSSAQASGAGYDASWGGGGADDDGAPAGGAYDGGDDFDAPGDGPADEEVEAYAASVGEEADDEDVDGGDDDGDDGDGAGAYDEPTDDEPDELPTDDAGEEGDEGEDELGDLAGVAKPKLRVVKGGKGVKVKVKAKPKAGVKLAARTAGVAVKRAALTSAGVPRALAPRVPGSTAVLGYNQLGQRTLFGLPMLWALGGFAAIGFALWHAMGPTRATARNPRRRRRTVSNPRPVWHPDPRVRKALQFRQDFHWGYPAHGVRTMRVSPPPKHGVQLGEVAEITYKTNKKGEKARFFTHDFEGPRPKLVMDIRNKRLHFVGGGYTVTADGIVG